MRRRHDGPTFPLGYPFLMDGYPAGPGNPMFGVGGMPCSDCCHARFGLVAPGVPEITVNWPCSTCGKTVGETGGYHHRQTCGTDVSAP